MENNFGEHHWNNIKDNLKLKYPFLNDSDLLWRDGTNKDDLMKDLAARIGVSWRELEKVVDKL
jgi:hypothetical protein